MPTPDDSARAPAIGPRWGRLILLAVVLAAAAVRLVYCFRLPVNTADAVRHLMYGLAVLDLGPGAADMPLAGVSEALVRIPWSERPFNYPPLALFWDTLVAAVHPSLAAYKVGLSALEALVAVLVWRLTGSRWLAVLYWASPLSLWWVSHEGQLDGLQNVFAVAALLALSRRRWLGWALLALAIQAKGFAVFLLPWFVAAELDARRVGEAPGWWGLLVGGLPTLAMMPFWNPWNLLLSSALHYNPYYWNPFAEGIFVWHPGWLILADQLASWALLATAAWLVVGRGRVRDGLGPLLFLVAIKLVTNAQPWYLLVLPILWLPLRDPRLRFALFAAVPLADLRSLVQVVSGPFGFTVDAFYSSRGIRPLTRFRLPL